MTGTFRLGKVRSIEIGAHWSVLVIGLVLVWSLAEGTLGVDAPGYPRLVYWLIAVVTVCCFWAALLAHELAHSIVAIRHGIRIDGITLWLFGGVSRLDGEPATPADELRIALAGPGMSLAIAAGCGALAVALAALHGPAVVVAGLAWLAVINGMLGVFNLAPGAPLDGGRVLHAIVWRRSGDRNRATMTAAKGGRVVGWVLIGIGFLLFGLGDVGGIWMALIGWFLLGAAQAEAAQVEVRDALADLRVADVMTPDPMTAPVDITVEELLDEYILRRTGSSLPLVDRRGNVTGLVTLRRLKQVPASERSRRGAAEIAIPIDHVTRAAPDESLVAMLERSERSDGDGRTLVFADGRLVGIVSPTDVSRALQRARLRHHPSTPVSRHA